MTRKLVTVQRIESLTPIPNADRIELCKLEGLGWAFVVPKGTYKVGDDAVYFEVDSFIPETNNDFEFLRDSSFKQMPDGRNGYRIKTRRLKKQISQGLLMPMNILPTARYTIGQDVSQLLGVTKWEPPMPKCLAGNAKGNFPDYLIKTDETRVQNLQSVLNRYVGTKCYVTEKIDGSSATYYVKDGIFGVCSRNNDLKLDDDNKTRNAFVKWAVDNDTEQKLLAKGINVAIQGEIYGERISGNRLKQNGHSVRFFNVFDIDKCRYYNYKEFVDFIQSLGYETVPILDTNFTLTNDVDKLVELSIGKSVINPSCMREGIVIRPIDEVLDLGMASNGGFGATGRLSFKVINPEYLMSEPENIDEEE